MKLLVTGSSGFIGSSVCTTAIERGWSVKAVVRQSHPSIHLPNIFIAECSESMDWSGAFSGVDCVVHCAARVHQMNETAQEAEVGYRDVNVNGTLNLARQAVMGGVKRFVFISSIKVNGEFTEFGSTFTNEVLSPPKDPYGLSKYQAEIGLKQIARDTGLEVVIIRPPLVYGQGVKANFLNLIKFVERGWQVPFGAIDNRRSLVYLDNIVDLILLCCEHPRAIGETFLVSDGQDVSTTDLIRFTAKAMGKRPLLIPIPMSWMVFAAKVIGKPQISQRICGSLQVDISHTCQTLNWSPPTSMEEGINKTIAAYLNENAS
ncbi:UDP-glucose 4-epimerase family protein [Vibrio paucivorans]